MWVSGDIDPVVELALEDGWILAAICVNIDAYIKIINNVPI